MSKVGDVQVEAALNGVLLAAYGDGDPVVVWMAPDQARDLAERLSRAANDATLPGERHEEQGLIT